MKILMVILALIILGVTCSICSAQIGLTQAEVINMFGKKNVDTGNSQCFYAVTNDLKLHIHFENKYKNYPQKNRCIKVLAMKTDPNRGNFEYEPYETKFSSQDIIDILSWQGIFTTNTTEKAWINLDTGVRCRLDRLISVEPAYALMIVDKVK